MYIIGAYLAAGDVPAVPTGDLPPGGIAAIVFFYVWTAFYAVSWNGTPWVVNSEAFPGAVRQVTQCFAASSNWLCELTLLPQFSTQSHRAHAARPAPSMGSEPR